MNDLKEEIQSELTTAARAKEAERADASHGWRVERPSNSSRELRTYPKRPRHWDAWSATEHEAWLTFRDKRDASIDAWRAFMAQVPEATRGLALAMEALSNESDDAGHKLIEARLKRLLPHYTDVIAEAFDENSDWDQLPFDPD